MMTGSRGAFHFAFSIGKRAPVPATFLQRYQGMEPDSLGKCDFSYCCDDVAVRAIVGRGLVGACTRHQDVARELARRVLVGAVVVSVFLLRLSPVKRRELLHPSYG
jgi:hypothetical protein